MNQITAQELYDRRERLGEITGADLHTIFRALCDGEPSPVGRTEISLEALRAHATALRESYAAHQAAGTVGAEDLLDIARFCEAF